MFEVGDELICLNTESKVDDIHNPLNHDDTYKVVEAINLFERLQYVKVQNTRTGENVGSYLSTRFGIYSNKPNREQPPIPKVELDEDLFTL